MSDTHVQICLYAYGLYMGLTQTGVHKVFAGALSCGLVLLELCGYALLTTPLTRCFFLSADNAQAVAAANASSLATSIKVAVAKAQASATASNGEEKLSPCSMPCYHVIKSLTVHLAAGRADTTALQALVHTVCLT